MPTVEKMHRVITEIKAFTVVLDFLGENRRQLGGWWKNFLDG